MRNSLNKVGDGLYIKTERSGRQGSFEDSILLPKWNFWHDIQVLEFPLLFYSQDCRKEWFQIIQASYHRFMVLPCFVTCCKWNPNITQGLRIRKVCSVIILIPLNQVWNHVHDNIFHWMCFYIFPEHFHTYFDLNLKTGLLTFYPGASLWLSGYNVVKGRSTSTY